MGEPRAPVGYRAEDDLPPPRPARVADLPFRRERPVRWYSPRVLADAGLQAMMASAFGNYLDKRELQSVLEQEPSDLSDRGEVWIDYLADTGDGFDATYTVASLVAGRELTIDGLATPLPRGDVLVLGGDAVYPDATAGGYAHRFEGPVHGSAAVDAAAAAAGPVRRPGKPRLVRRADQLPARLRPAEDDRGMADRAAAQLLRAQAPPPLLAVGHRHPHRRLHRRTAAALLRRARRRRGRPHHPVHRRAQLGEGPRRPGRLPQPRLPRAEGHHPQGRGGRPDAGRRPASLRPLCRAGGPPPEDHRRGRRGLPPPHPRPAIADIGAQRPRPPRDGDDPCLGRDVPHGGAVPSAGPRDARPAAAQSLCRPGRGGAAPAADRRRVPCAHGPGPGRRRRRGAAEDAGALLPGLLRAVTPGEVLTQILSSPVSLGILVALLLALVAFAKPPRQTPPRGVPWVKRGMGLAHACLHAVGVALAAWATLLGASFAAPGWPLTTSVYVGALAVGGAVGSLSLALYLTVANAVWGAEDNHAFSAQRRTDHKSFLRLHLGPDGRLEVYAIGIARACHRWRAVPDAGEDDAAWLAPAADGPTPHLIERVTVTGPSGTAPHEGQP